MSRIGRMPIPVPTGVEVKIEEDGLVTVKGPKGQLTRRFPAFIGITREDSSLIVSRPSDAATHRALHGLSRSLLANMVTGVTTGFRKNLEIAGVGYRAALEGKDLVLQVGFSHAVRMTPPEGIAFVIETPTRLGVTGIDKEIVGEQAAKIRAVRPPEPYKGKGIRYLGERIRRKAGKAGKVGGKK